jgi:hypothetical protein
LWHSAVDKANFGIFAEYLKVHGAISCDKPFNDLGDDTNPIGNKKALGGKALHYSYTTFVCVLSVINTHSSEVPNFAFHEHCGLDAVDFYEITNL